MTGKSKKIISISVTSIAIALVILASYLVLHHRSISYTAFALHETNNALSNPYIGWYQIYAYRLARVDDAALHKLDKDLTKDDNRLCLLQLNIKDFRDSGISPEALTQFDRLLSSYRDHNKSVILRVLYDWDGKARTSEPDELNTIYRHIDALSSVINQHVDTVYINQGILVGNYGEMHGSRYMSDETMAAITDYLSSAIDPSIFLAVRTPDHRQLILATDSPLSPEEAYSGDLAARLSLFNDGMLGSADDLGTYSDRNAGIRYQNNLCLYVPNGGEVVKNNPYNDIENAVTDLSAMHVSYLNEGYDTEVLDKWKTSTYQGENGYDYISRHLGYRFFVTDSSCEISGFINQTVQLAFTVQNSGFSNCYKPMDISLTLIPSSKNSLSEDSQSDDSLSEYRYHVDSDIRFLNAGSSNRYSLSVPVDSIEPGTYNLYVNLTDSSGGQIQFANDTMTADGVKSGTLTVD